jgi:hypothetical protein
VDAGNPNYHEANVKGAKRLRQQDWPSYRDGRPAWPSSPTFFEKMDQLRRGFTYPEMPAPSVTRRVSLADFNDSIDLANRIISFNVIGIRSNVEIPSKYLGHFRYRWNMLILTTYKCPPGLARFLASRWLCDPTSLWLERAVPLKKFLREVPVAIINRSFLGQIDFDPSASGSDYEYESETFSDSYEVGGMSAPPPWYD